MSFYNHQSALRRPGNKNKIADKIIGYFPTDFDCLISLFYGTGSLENRFVGKAKYLIANDFDSEVSNFYNVLMTQPDALIEAIELIPYYQDCLNAFKANLPSESVLRAAAFIVLSNWSYMGKNDTLRFDSQANSKRITLRNLKENYKLLVCNPITTVQFMSCDFREVLGKISFKDKRNCFIYLDSPYLGTTNNYQTPQWTQQDMTDCLDLMLSCGIRCAMSEFDNPVVVKAALDRGLFIHQIGERQSMKNRNTEILILNYRNQKGLFE